MKKFGFALAAIVALGLVLLAAGWWLGERKMHRTVEVRPVEVRYLADPATLEKGRYLYASRGCVGCHGDDGAGRLFMDSGPLRVRAPNITVGKDGLGTRYRPGDWDRAIRHGVDPQGRPLQVMPSVEFSRLSDEDLEALVAYVRSLPAASGGRAELSYPFAAKVLYGFGYLKDSAARIDHSLPPAPPQSPEVSARYGAYVAQMCVGCHGAQLEGGSIPGSPPDWPPAPNLRGGASDSALARYPDAAALRHLFRTGTRADGSKVKVMPFNALKAFTDTDVEALRLYLSRLPAKP